VTSKINLICASTVAMSDYTKTKGHDQLDMHQNCLVAVGIMPIKMFIDKEL
jgi:hypothetical protein